MTKTNVLIGLLAVSLGLNLYAASYTLGHHARQRVVLTNLTHRQLDALLGTLPASKREALRNNVQQDIERVRERTREIKHEREQLAQLLMAPELNHRAIEDHFARIRQHSVQSQEQMQNIVLTTFNQMSPTEREATVTRIMETHDK